MSGKGGVEVVEAAGDGVVAESAAATSDSIVEPSSGLLLSDSEKSTEGAVPSTEAL